MSVEIGTVDAGELHLAADRETAAAAHSRSVDHYGIHRHGGLYPIFLCKKTYEFHHHERTDRNDLVVLLTRFDQRAQSVGDKSLFARASVVGHQTVFVGYRAELVLEDHEIFRAEADYRVNGRAVFVEFFRHGICDRASDTAADDGDLLPAFGFGRASERTDEVPYIFTLGEGVQLFRRRTDDLEDYRDGAAFAVVISHGERNALSVFVNAKNYELTRFDLCGDERRVDHHLRDRRVQIFLFYYFVHRYIITFPYQRGLRKAKAAQCVRRTTLHCI